MFTNRRIFYLKCVIVVVLLYLFAYIFTNSNTSEIIRELQQSGRNLAALDHQQSSPEHLDSITNLQNAPETLVIAPTEKSDKLVKELKIVSTVKTVPSSSEDPRVAVLNKVREVTKCLDKPLIPKIQQRGDYWVLYNYVRAERRHKCHETITYTTHADYSFLDNLVPLIERWKGPVSIALHAPGTDFSATLDSIAYLRDCTSPFVKEFVTFHVYFSTKHVPKQVPRHDKVLQESFNCSQTSPFFNVSSDQMYKTQKKLLYPVNVGRNVARETAQTHYILPSDIELYPSPNIIHKFLQMIAENTGPLLSKNPKVFPLHLFEVSGNQQVPENKTVLKEMLVNGTALPFHKKLCPGCHNVPKSKEWRDANETKGLHVFHVGKRMGYYVHWEPIFIGTHADPLYDERLSWEGKSDKMTQVPRHDKVLQESFNCSQTSPFFNVSSDQMYKTQKKLLYPVNVGRNVARETAQTHYILPSDIELYPSPNIIHKFLQMIAENTGPLLSKNPKVFPLHLFEVSGNQQVPENKTVLKEMLVNGTALPFHKKLCPGCHNVPKSKEWRDANETKGLHVFHVGKRMGYYVHWEPIFIGTHADPLYDERLSWEGKSDKMTQGYALCVLDYDFLILDNSFLVHKPGIKVYKKDPKRALLAAKTNQLIKKIIFPELKVIYGVKKGCAV